MSVDNYIACICEGSAERAIIELLLENDKLFFNTLNLLDDKILRCRNGKEFERTYLRKQFNKEITVVRILDSRNENFKLGKAYENKVDVINVVTAPEIEMLIILNEKKYEDFKKSKLKPSEFCKINLKYSSVKSFEFVKNYFSDIDDLISAITEYKRVSNIRKEEKTLFDLLAENWN